MSGVRLQVDGAGWRSWMETVADSYPGLVPVAKGNGYGFGLDVLARESERLGVDTVAVGLPAEVAHVRDGFSGDIVVLNPWRPDSEPAAAIVHDPRVISTVSRVEDVAALAATGQRPRVVIEVLTSMRRHGIAANELPNVAPYLDQLTCEGWVIHLPHAEEGRVREAETLAVACHAVAPEPIWFSHIDGANASRITTELGVGLRMRVGTELWLGGPTRTRTVSATVLDVHPIQRGDRIGYWQRKAPHDGWLVIVAGGTAHGIGMEAPTSARSNRARAVSVATGALAATGRALSPYTIDGKKRWFAEPPHMQSSMVLLPKDATPPQVGDEVPVEVRATTAVADQVLISD